MAKTKTAKTSKPAKKTFHKKPAAETTTPIVSETTPQATAPTDQVETPQQVETEIQPNPEPEPKPEQASTQPQTATEDITPIASTINPPQDDEESSAIADDSTKTANTQSQTTDTTDSTPAPLQEEDSQNQTHPAESLMADENGGGIKKLLIFALIIVILATASVSFYYFYVKKLKTASDKPQPTPAAQTSESQSQTSSQTLNKADWTLEILNGSGKTGAAAALAEKLTAKGYQVIKTGNAPEDTATSQVFFADSTAGQADLFLEDIKEELPNPTNSGSLNDSTASARIVIGAE